eukprot:Tbor_TRINITY_DN4244_c0_g1::TRINITY_DN4244_c0_g1_i1::g.24007::m.24007
MVIRSSFKKESKISPHTERIPLSFGSNFHDDPLMRNNLKKSHALNYCAIGSAVPDHYAPHQIYNYSGMPFEPEYLKDPSNPNVSRNYRRDNVDPNKYPVPDTPKLNFSGYFKEPVYESMEETVRIRKLCITYHTEDDSIDIKEARQLNSGISQGQFLARQKVPKDGGDGKQKGLIKLEDIFIGAILPVYSRDILIVDCDANTRAFLKNKGIELGESISWPDDEDSFNVSHAKKLASINPKRQIPVIDMEHKRALESLTSGGAISKHHPEDVRCAQQFYSNKINQHLSFAAYLDNRGQISGDLHHTSIHYYLENDTIEIIEKRPENSGRDGGTKLLTRQRIPRKGTDPTKSRFQQNTFGVLLKNDFVVAVDIQIGENLNVHGRNYFIYDADEFTRNYFINQYGIQLPPAVDILNVEKIFDKPTVVHYPPPHNGFGSEEDSLQNCKSLSYKPPRFDHEKSWREGGKMMIFSAELITEDKTDKERQFVITFHRATDEIEISENMVRNSGLIGGRFLQRGRHLKQLPNGHKVPFTPDDFEEGAVVFISGRNFRLLKMDARSRRIVSGIEEKVTEDRVKELVMLFRTLVSTKYLHIHQAFREMAPSSTITISDIVEFFRKSSARVTEEEAAYVVQYISPSGNGCVSYHAFLKFVDGSDGTDVMDAASNNIKSIKNVNMSLDTASDSNNPVYKEASRNDSLQYKKNQLKKVLIDKLVARRGTVQEIFRMMAGYQFNSRLSRFEFERGLIHILHFNVPEEDIQVLIDTVFEGDDVISFKQFQEFIES